MSNTHHVHSKLQALKLGGMLDTLDLRLQQAQQGHLGGGEQPCHPHRQRGGVGHVPGRWGFAGLPASLCQAHCKFKRCLCGYPDMGAADDGYGGQASSRAHLRPYWPQAHDFAGFIYVGLLLEGAIFGLGMAIVTPSTTALVADLCKAGKYGAALGVFGTIWDMGEASGPILAGALIFAFGGLQTASAYLGAFSIIAVVMVLAGLAFSMAVSEPRTAVEKG